MERKEYFERLKNCLIIKLDDDDHPLFDADFLVGPMWTTRVSLGEWKEGATEATGTLSLQLALNEHVVSPQSACFRFDDGAQVNWGTANDPPSGNEAGEFEQAVMAEMALRIIRRLAMQAVPGYTEHARNIHLAFVGFADL